MQSLSRKQRFRVKNVQDLRSIEKIKIAALVMQYIHLAAIIFCTYFAKVDRDAKL